MGSTPSRAVSRYRDAQGRGNVRDPGLQIPSRAPNQPPVFSWPGFGGQSLSVQRATLNLNAHPLGMCFVDDPNANFLGLSQKSFVSNSRVSGPTWSRGVSLLCLQRVPGSWQGEACNLCWVSASEAPGHTRWAGMDRNASHLSIGLMFLWKRQRENLVSHELEIGQQGI